MKNTCKFNFVSKLAGRMFLRTNFFIDTTLLTIQRWMNVVSILQITVQITVIRRWKWSKIGIRVFNAAQYCYNVGVQGCNNVETTLHNVYATVFQHCTMSLQRCFNVIWYYLNVALTWPQHQLKVYQTNLAGGKYRFAENL